MTYRLFAAAGLAGLLTTQAPAADLSIEVHGIRSGDGRVQLAVHGPGSRDTFPSGDGAVAQHGQPAQAGAVHFVVGDLSPGRYALAAYHDENDNGELDTNLIGIPSEGYGFGNDASATFGPPDFEAAAVTVGDVSAVTALTLSY